MSVPNQSGMPQVGCRWKTDNRWWRLIRSFQSSLAKALGGWGFQLAAVSLEELTCLHVLTKQHCYEVTGWEALIG